MLLPLAWRTGAIPLKLASSAADPKRSRSVPKAVRSRGASAAPTGARQVPKQEAIGMGVKELGDLLFVARDLGQEDFELLSEHL